MRGTDSPSSSRPSTASRRVDSEIYIEIREGPDPPKNTAHAALSPLTGTLVAPDIKIGPVPNNIIVESATVTIEGTVTDIARLKDVYQGQRQEGLLQGRGGDNEVIGFKAALPKTG